MLGTILFFILAAIAVASAIGMLTSTNAVHAALFLVLNFLTVALFYLGLNAPFLAMVQVTVYAGAIMVLFLFVIMLLGAERVELTSRLRWQAPLAIVLALLLMATGTVLVLSPEVNASLGLPQPLQGTPAETGFGSPAEIGTLLFTQYLLPFQAVGVLLLVAMIGAVVLAKGSLKQIDRKDEAEIQTPTASLERS
ncbi:MAG TPA: NADH-quinone oxidoreductase subunit J [Aggregatilineales bacterium]|nr:NADH-quinone oxidoreductase subunit J [Aggregatilineales bacterium]HPV06171.1 NADH-quinone oxidoreductase subunit J [Aggregatilineales bacterium]HQA67040.1 NADH-quinone oxidoreductase subunit J [Aggregatilineales bacterium]